MSVIHTREKLDQFVLDIGFLHIKSEQIFKLKYLMPIGLIFCIGSVLILSKFPSIHIYLGILQAIFMTGFLVNSIYSFKKRAKLITNSL